jgi:UDP-N-acetylglucosamine--N-acetylmuramyl-(pentapeptide) pyrophosphoryl-undecaprenol N-acetylglucosamine transferase
MKLNKIIIAGGGTGGHIFPAIAVANALRQIDKTIQILFVGAKGKMEMEKVPQAGYSIEGLDIAGFNRSNLLKNWSLPFKLIKSFLQVKNIFKSFQPDAVFGVGGYSSFPVLRYAQRLGIPSFLHEANSYAGKANKMLGKKATKVMVATDGMERFFPSAKILKTGNPVRTEIISKSFSLEDAYEFFGLKQGKPTLLIIGGSLGAKSINHAIAKGIASLIESGLQVIWQTGKGNVELVGEDIRKQKEVCITEFITKMNYAYAIADLVVSRAGAIALAEICATGKASILVPYPFAAEDHQTENAMTLVRHDAAVIVKDDQAADQLIGTIEILMNDKEKLKALENASSALFVKDADQRIASEIIHSIEQK